MYHSAEVRWFLAGAIPDELHAWFAGPATPPPYVEGLEEPRVDRYLLLPGCASVGVKVRQGKFEVKALRRPPAVLKLPHDVVGRSDTWVKWSYDEPPPEPFVTALLSAPAKRSESDTADWADVTKRRWMRKFSLDGPLTEVPFDQRPNRGCNFELSQISIYGTHQWSLAFEAFGAVNLADGFLRQVATALFSDYPPPVPLTEATSWSYPAWLLQLHCILQQTEA